MVLDPKGNQMATTPILAQPHGRELDCFVACEGAHGTVAVRRGQTMFGRSAKRFPPEDSIMATTRSLTPDLYAVLSGTLDSSAMPRILTSFGNASQNNV
jgi:hypothetical protein